MPGQVKASTPNTIAQMPRRTSSHQFLPMNSSMTILLPHRDDHLS